MFVNSQLSDINNRDVNFSWGMSNATGSNLQEGGDFQQQVNEIRNAINSRKNKSIAECLTSKPQILLGTQIQRGGNISQERCPQHFNNENYNIENRFIQNSVRFADVQNEKEPLVVVEKSTRSLNKNKYESELRNLRKANNQLEGKLSEIKDFNYDIKSSLKLNQQSGGNTSFTRESNQTTLKKPQSAAQIGTSTLMNARQGTSFISASQEQDKPKVSNLYDNKKTLASMIDSVSIEARKQALQKQEDGEEVKELKEQRNKIEEKRVKTVNDLESENTKLKNKAIRAQYEAEEVEDKIKQIENQRHVYQKDVKNKQKDVKTKQNEISLMIQKKSKLESDITSNRLLLKDREAEITRQRDKLKLNTSERIKSLRDHELHIQMRNVASLDFEKVRQDRDRIMEEMEKRQVEANDKYNQQSQKLFHSQNELQAVERQITTLENFIEEEKKEIQKLKIANKMLKEKQEEMENMERKLRKKEKTIIGLESELELVRREKKIEIIEKIVEKPVVIEKPVIVEKEVIIREEIKVDEPLEKELALLREELHLLDNGLKEKTSEAEYWKKRFQDSELQGKHNVGAIQETFNSERQNMRIQHEKGIQEIQTLQSKMNALLAEVHTLSNINITKNREVQDQLHHLIKNNQSLENILVANSFNSIPVSVQLPISSRYASYQ